MTSGLIRTTISNERGEYAFASVLPGVYIGSARYSQVVGTMSDSNTPSHAVSVTKIG